MKKEANAIRNTHAQRKAQLGRIFSRHSGSYFETLDMSKAQRRRGPRKRQEDTRDRI